MIVLDRKIQHGVLVLLATCLCFHGFFLMFSGWWLPEVPLLLKAAGISWVIACVSAAFAIKRPYLQFGAISLWLFVSCWQWWTVTDERSFQWFLYQNMLPLIAIASSSVLCLKSKRQPA